MILTGNYIVNNRINLLLVSSIFLTNICIAEESPKFNVGASGMIVGYNDDDGAPYKINAGYSFTENLALEANYLNFGDSNRFDGTGDISATAYSIELLAKFPIGDFTAYAKFGNTWWSEEGSVNAYPWDGTNIQNIDESGNDFIYGLGMSYAIFSNFSVKLEYQESEINNHTANPFSIGFDFAF